MIVLKIDVIKIDKAHLFKGKSGTYLDASLRENRDGHDKYGNDGFITQSVGRDARERGEKGPIIGNWRHIEGGKRTGATQTAKDAPRSDRGTDGGTDTSGGGDLPF